MRFLWLCCLFLLLINCEDKKSKPKTTKQPTNSTQINTKTPKKADSLNKPQRQYPYLTDDNAMAFFDDYAEKHPENKVRLTTDFGIIDIQLFDKVKYHKANFIYLTKQHYFDNTQFYRVVKNFIIQGGSTDDPKVMRKRKTIGRYLLPPDTRHGYKHIRGVISMPSSNIENPHKLASPYEFFIVQSPNGAHHLDGHYTIFGKVIKGMDVVDKIASQETDEAEWPLHNIYIKKAEIIK